MKVFEQFFFVVLFIMLYKVVLTQSVGEFLQSDNQVKALAKYFPVVLFTLLYKSSLTFEFE